MKSEITFTFTALLIFILYFIFEQPNWKWKAKPSIPFVVGVALLLSSVSYYWHIDDEVLAEKKILAAAQKKASNMAEIEEKRTRINKLSDQYEEMIQSKERVFKLIELIVIPLAVSVIAASLLLRVDLNFASRMKQFGLRFKRLKEHENVLQEARRELIDALDATALSAIIKEKVLTIERLQRTVWEERQRFLEEFKDLIGSDLVEVNNVLTEDKIL